MEDLEIEFTGERTMGHAHVSRAEERTVRRNIRERNGGGDACARERPLTRRCRHDTLARDSLARARGPLLTIRRRFAHRVTFRSYRCALRWCGLLLAIAATAAPACTQAVLGFGDDATTIPGGTVRMTFTDTWTRFDERFTAGDGSSIDTHAQIRRAPISLELGVTNRLMLGVMVPSVGTQQIATYFPESTTTIHADSSRTFDRSDVGDAEVSLKLVWVGALPERARTAVTGVHVRGALTALVRLGTGKPPRATEQFGVGTGDGQTDLEASSQWDLLFGRRYWMSVVGRYGRQLSDTRLVRVATPGDPFDPNAGPVLAERALGDYYEIEATPRLGLGDYFSIGAQYRYYHKARDSYTGTRDTTDAAGQPVHLDASTLDASSDVTEQWASVGIVYSSVAAVDRGHGNHRFEFTLRYTRVVSVSGGALVRPKPATWAAGARFYVRLWGSAARAERADPR